MKPLLSSASALHRTMQCPVSAQADEPVRPEYVMKAAERGTVIHEYLEHQGTADVYWDLFEKYPQHQDDCERIELGKTAGHYTQYPTRELKFVHNVIKGTTRVLWDKEARNYGELLPEEVSGTADVVVPGFSIFEVWDYKTGRDVRRMLPIKQNEQLLFLAYCVSKTLCPNATQARVGIQHILKTKINNYDCLVDKFDLEAFGGRLKRSHKLATEVQETKKVFPGSWCKYCPAEDCKNWKKYNGR